MREKRGRAEERLVSAREKRVETEGAIRQTLNGVNWTDAELRAGTVQKLEEPILARARDLRRAAVAG